MNLKDLVYKIVARTRLRGSEPVEVAVELLHSGAFQGERKLTREFFDHVTATLHELVAEGRLRPGQWMASDGGAIAVYEAL